MRSVAVGICAVLLLGLVVPAMCALPNDMPIYPKGKVDFELTLTEQDFLPAIKQFIPTIPQIAQQAIGVKMGNDEAKKAIQSVFNDDFVKELSACISGLQKVSVTSFTVPKGTTPAALGDFYVLKFGLTKGWQKTLRAEQGSSFVRLYTMPDLAAMLAIAMDGQRVVLANTEGKIDFAGLTKLATKMVPLAMQIPRMMQQPTPAPDAQPAPPQVEEQSTTPGAPSEPAEPAEPEPPGTEQN